MMILKMIPRRSKLTSLSLKKRNTLTMLAMQPHSLAVVKHMNKNLLRKNSLVLVFTTNTKISKLSLKKWELSRKQLSIKSQKKSKTIRQISNLTCIFN